MLKDVQRKAAASPQADDFKKEAKAEVVHNPDGSWTATVRGEENILKAMRMQNGIRKIEVEKGRRIAASKATETVVTREGREMQFPAHLVDQVKDKRGWRPKRYYGRAKARWVARDGELVRVF